MAPEIDFLAIGREFPAGAIGYDDRQAVGHRVAALDDLPGTQLALFFRLVIVGVPADGRGVYQHVGSRQRHQAGGLRVPLVPAHQQAQLADPGLDRAKTVEFTAGIAGGEVEFLIETRIVRDVHLAIKARTAVARVHHQGGIVVEPGGALFEDGDHQHDIEFLRQRFKTLPGRTVERLGQVELVGRLGLAEVEAAVQFLQHHQPGPPGGGEANLPFGFRLVGGGIGAAALLNQCDFKHRKALLGVIAW